MQEGVGLWILILERDAYVHDHCLGYRHNYLLFCQLPNSNLFTHCMLFSREKPLVNTMAPGFIFYHIIFRSIKSKTQKYLAAIYAILFYFTLVLIFYTYHYQMSSLQVTVKGLTTPLSRWVQVFVCLCRCYHWRLVCSSYWIDTLVLNWGKYLSLLCCITLFSSREKSMQAQDVALCAFLSIAQQ